VNSHLHSKFPANLSRTVVTSTIHTLCTLSRQNKRNWRRSTHTCNIQWMQFKCCK